MPIPALVVEELLAPISAEHPGGEDITVAPEWQAINEARRRDKLLERQNTDWGLIRELVSDALAHKTKDLRLAVWLIEAESTLHGFSGLRDSLAVLRGLIAGFWDSGLFPEAEAGDLQFRAMPLEWLGGENFPRIVRQVPLTARTDSGADYSYLDYRQSRAIGWEKDLRNANGDLDEEKQRRRESALASGGISAEMFEEAIKNTRRAGMEAIHADFQQAWTEFQELDKIVDAKFANDAPGMSEARDAFDDCRRLIEEFLKRKREEEPDVQPAAAQTNGQATAGAVQAAGFAIPEASFLEADGGGSWAEAEKLITVGKIQEGLAAMTRLAAQENGRVRFQHRLRLAEICLSAHKDRLAVAILEELAKQIEELHLEKWESPELLGRVWGRLYRCYQKEEPGSERAVRAVQLFDQLCRLDPWQALRWCE